MRLARSANCIVMRHITANPWPQTMARALRCVIWSLKFTLGFQHIAVRIVGVFLAGNVVYPRRRSVNGMIL
jgi:hypothetical protein